MTITELNRYLLIKAPNAILSPLHTQGSAQVLVDKTTGKIIEIALGNRQCISSLVDIDTEIIELNHDQLLMSGLVDAHVHLNEPGRTEWEGFETGTKAAAAGGVTTVIDMPLNAIPPTTTVENLNIKLNAAKGQCHVDVGFWGGVVPDNANELPALIQKGVRGFKCFLMESGVIEFPCVNEAEIRLAMDRMINSDRVLLFHAELEGCQKSLQHKDDDDDDDDQKAYTSFLKSRPEELETNAIYMIIRLCKEYYDQGKPVNTHIVHLSAASAIPLIRAAKQEGIPLTVETCFHYLYFTAEDIEDGATYYKCCPPIREASNREKLWEALLDGTIDYVVSDHSPCTAKLKKTVTGNFNQAWGGIASVQFGLSILWTECHKRGASPQKIAQWLSLFPAKRATLDHKKGKIQVGYDGDFVIWRPDFTFKIHVDDVYFKNKASPYIGKTLYGIVDQTILRGSVIYNREKSNPFIEIPIGQSLLE
ncbi:allantoinase [Cokeromyces recurvatus]|uniref:allantoinase n=1 Tax=Cokeromyces recurvatus TaxID=90255 RepID=UPI00221FC234|nr:allantoinase [Cokeromyces recurvatus]KAI7903532.1 allantoinase [Cokeromyces recurvatus]